MLLVLASCTPLTPKGEKYEVLLFFNKTPLLCAPSRWEEKPQAWMLTSGMQNREEPGNLGKAALQND